MPGLLYTLCDCLKCITHRRDVKKHIRRLYFDVQSNYMDKLAVLDRSEPEMSGRQYKSLHRCIYLSELYMCDKVRLGYDDDRFFKIRNCRTSLKNIVNENDLICRIAIPKLQCDKLCVNECLQNAGFCVDRFSVFYPMSDEEFSRHYTRL